MSKQIFSVVLIFQMKGCSQDLSLAIYGQLVTDSEEIVDMIVKGSNQCTMSQGIQQLVSVLF
jgi:hypothetical protein